MKPPPGLSRCSHQGRTRCPSTYRRSDPVTCFIWELLIIMFITAAGIRQLTPRAAFTGIQSPSPMLSTLLLFRNSHDRGRTTLTFSPLGCMIAANQAGMTRMSCGSLLPCEGNSRTMLIMPTDIIKKEHPARSYSQAVHLL